MQAHEKLESACATTSRQLEMASEIVESEFGADLEGRYAGLVAAALLALATNYTAAMGGTPAAVDWQAARDALAPIRVPPMIIVQAGTLGLDRVRLRVTHP